ncbi:c-type cytochrome [Seminibacterium arietis]|uniref:C-type cytochrome n=1 Tax=Seminibacterium arietis TaxID=1173502 RepID=A0ABW3I8U7_9PAST
MKNYSIFFAVTLIVTASLSHAQNPLENDAEKLKQGQRLFNHSCAMCHGKQAEKSAFGKSAIINTLKKDEIITALTKRKSGEIIGGGNGAKSRLTENEIEIIAEYIQTLIK